MNVDFARPRPALWSLLSTKERIQTGVLVVAAVAYLAVLAYVLVGDEPLTSRERTRFLVIGGGILAVSFSWWRTLSRRAAA